MPCLREQPYVFSVYTHEPFQRSGFGHLAHPFMLATCIACLPPPFYFLTFLFPLLLHFLSVLLKLFAHHSYSYCRRSSLLAPGLPGFTVDTLKPMFDLTTLFIVKVAYHVACKCVGRWTFLKASQTLKRKEVITSHD